MWVVLAVASISCTNEVGWINRKNETCADYAGNNWCNGDSVNIINGLKGINGINRCHGINCAVYNNRPTDSCCTCGKGNMPYAVKYLTRCLYSPYPRVVLIGSATLSECADACHFTPGCYLFAYMHKRCYDTSKTTGYCLEFSETEMDLDDPDIDIVFRIDRPVPKLEIPSFVHIPPHKRKRLPAPTALSGGLVGGAILALIMALLFNKRYESKKSTSVEK